MKEEEEKELDRHDVNNIQIDHEITPMEYATFPEYYIKNGQMQKVKTVNEWLEGYWAEYIAYKKRDA